MFPLTHLSGKSWLPGNSLVMWCSPAEVWVFFQLQNNYLVPVSCWFPLTDLKVLCYMRSNLLLTWFLRLTSIKQRVLNTESRGRREVSRMSGLLLEEWLCSSPLQACCKDVSLVPSPPFLFPPPEDQQCACTYQNISVLISLKAQMSFSALQKTTRCLFRFYCSGGNKSSGQRRRENSCGSRKGWSRTNRAVCSIASN